MELKVDTLINFDNITSLILSRHSIRRYSLKEIEKDKIDIIKNEIDKINQLSNLSISLVINEKEAFSSFLSHYGNFNNVNNYLIIKGDKNDKDIYYKAGFYGEHLVLLMEQLGLSSCWVGVSYKKNVIKKQIKDNEKLIIVICFGYKEKDGGFHKNKDINKLYEAKRDNVPSWFMLSLEQARLAPTALNQQNFKFILNSDNSVTLINKGGPFSKVDLGIVKYHFDSVSPYKAIIKK